VEYISPSSLAVFETDLDEFYLKYLAETRPPRIPQTAPMAVGSSFDAYVKNYLHQGLFGKSTEYALDTLIEKQVESQNRDQARIDGEIAFNAYRLSGALADLMLLLTKSPTDPQFEFEIRGPLENFGDKVDEVTILGKPDLKFQTHLRRDVVLDWKVNGFYSKASPMKGYVRIRDGWINKPASRSSNTIHKDAQPMDFGGINVNIADYLENFNSGWATQLSMYGWLCDAVSPVYAIDQLACKGRNEIRIAEHRTKISHNFHIDLIARLRCMWLRIHSDHFFLDMSKKDSQARCALLDKQYQTFEGTSERDKWMQNISRGA